MKNSSFQRSRGHITQVNHNILFFMRIDVYKRNMYYTETVFFDAEAEMALSVFFTQNDIIIT